MSNSPFPGMDPYLERSWRDVHHSLCTYARDDIQTKLGDGLVARIDERLVVESADEPLRSIHPDVMVLRRAGKWSGETPKPASSVGLAEPIELVMADEISEGFIEIIDVRSGGKLITVIEFLSMTNKSPGSGRDSYEKKRAELLQAQVSLVEINLLRSGQPLPWVTTTVRVDASKSAYQSVVRKGWERRKLYFYPMPLQTRLSAIAIPLRPTDPAIPLDLQALIDRVYVNGAYDLEIDYSENLNPPLTGEDLEWADRMIKARGVH